MIDVETRLAAAALRGVLEAVEADPALAGPVLARLLVAPAPVTTATTSGRLRPAVAAPAAPKKKKARQPQAAPTEGPPAADEPKAEPEAGRLAALLIERCGGVDSAAARTGLGRSSLMKWKAGGNASPGALERLREAVHAVEDQDGRAIDRGSLRRPGAVPEPDQADAGDDAA